ncbi:hypothetical protein IW261DRAFT_687203 [Armillaria novae-zelandiae]|uniref:Uncharacterized protein n=1 Tax=Armillaria novae-zelandiae TaxID=153914 RepID=A0AA39KC01_9AGAR|nr:hypothetical protein IW261DRAFT_687203 [Armillaria novae-zelandiae]
MIHTLEINRALRRAFKDRYQKRETKANTSSKGETTQNQIHIVMGKTSVAKNHPPREKGIHYWPSAFLGDHLSAQLEPGGSGDARVSFPSLVLLAHLLLFATLPQPSGWNFNHITHLILSCFSAEILLGLLGNFLFCDSRCDSR